MFTFGYSCNSIPPARQTYSRIPQNFLMPAPGFSYRTKSEQVLHLGKTGGRAQAAKYRLVRKFLEKSGERGRNRTFNLVIKSHLLCQLSYAPDFNATKVVAGVHFWCNGNIVSSAAKQL